MTYLFEEYVHDTVSAKSETALFGCLQKALRMQGYEQIVFCIFNEPELPTLNCHFGYYQHAVDDWNRHYTENDYVRIDPVVQAVKSGRTTFAWRDLPQFFTLTRAQQQYMGLVSDLGLHQGVAVTLGRGRAGIGLSTDDPLDSRPANLRLITAIGSHFYEVFREYKRPPAQALDDAETLTVKEREVLSWVASGKTDCEIAEILGISKNTVDVHLRSIFRKLSAFNRLTAAIRGIKLGYISL